jgi:hypothetical protein
MFLALLFLVALVGMISPVPRLLGYVIVVAKETDQVTSIMLNFLRRMLDVFTMVGLPLIYLWGYTTLGEEYNLWLTWIAVYVIVYFWLSEQRRISSLTTELVWNFILGAGVCFNLLILNDLGNRFGGLDITMLIGNGPIILLLLMQFHKRHRLFYLGKGKQLPASASNEDGLLDEQLIINGHTGFHDAKYPAGFSLAALELPFLQKTGLFIVGGGLIVAITTLPGFLLGWEYTLLGW